MAMGLAACLGQTLQLGNGDGGTATCSPSGSAAAVADAGPWDSGASLAPLVGTWTGYAEAYQFPSGSDSIVLAFAAGSDGGIHGALTYGQGTPPPPPTDPNADYPPTGWANHQFPWLVEGFPFTVLRPSFDGTRLRISSQSHEFWKPWCELQTPTGDGWPCGTYACVPNGAGMGTSALTTIMDPATGMEVAVKTSKRTLCDPGGACQCSATSCSTDMSDADEVFDLRLSSPDHLDGTLAGTGNVHFARMP
jgi:hypothetical protein